MLIYLNFNFNQIVVCLKWRIARLVRQRNPSRRERIRPFDLNSYFCIGLHRASVVQIPVNSREQRSTSNPDPAHAQEGHPRKEPVHEPRLSQLLVPPPAPLWIEQEPAGSECVQTAHIHSHRESHELEFKRIHVGEFYSDF